jgi:hypothetical protein
MRSLWIRNEARPRRIAVATTCLVTGWLLLSAPSSFAQDAAPPPDSAVPAQPAPAPKAGVFEAIGRWFDQGASNFRDHLRGAKRKMDDLGDDAVANTKGFSDQAAQAGKNAAEAGKSAAEATKNAVDAVAKLPTARMMSGRERCINAPNGAPDCVAAAEALCRKHGYTSGKSMDFTSAEECPPRALLGQAPREECTTVTFISRAMCQ